MPKINLPKEMLGKESLKSLPAKEKEEYLNNLIKRILELNPNGITLTQIKEKMGLSSSTLWHHLEVLKCTALSRKISRGNIDIYYPFGHFKTLVESKKGDATYSISSVKNDDGNFICIHEKRDNRMGSHIVVRGIAIPITLTEDLDKALKKAKRHN
jgi:hypothetical protein